jgi:hypothetical protein
MTKPQLTFLALALACALFVVGCGGSDGESISQTDSTARTANAGPLTKAELIKRGDEICAKADQRIDFQAPGYREAHEKELSKLSPIAAEEKMIRIFLFPSIRRQVRELEALEPPVGEEKKIQAIITAIDVGMRKAVKEPYIVSQEVFGKYPFVEVEELAQAYGFEECDTPT